MGRLSSVLTLASLFLFVVFAAAGIGELFGTTQVWVVNGPLSYTLAAPRGLPIWLSRPAEVDYVFERHRACLGVHELQQKSGARVIFLPYWMLLIVTGIVPAVWLYRELSLHRRRSQLTR